MSRLFAVGATSTGLFQGMDKEARSFRENTLTGGFTQKHARFWMSEDQRFYTHRAIMRTLANLIERGVIKA
jgi:hypothetical protein